MVARSVSELRDEVRRLAVTADSPDGAVRVTITTHGPQVELRSGLVSTHSEQSAATQLSAAVREAVVRYQEAVAKLLSSFRDQEPSPDLAPSLGSVGDPYDNSVAEAFWGRLQTELLDRHRWRTRVELANAIFEYIEGFGMLPGIVEADRRRREVPLAVCPDSLVSPRPRQRVPLPGAPAPPPP